MKNFIMIDDFKSIATEQDLIVLSDSNTSIIQKCNEIAIDEALCYLSEYYDVEKLFKDITEYSEIVPYKVGARIYYKEYIGTPATEYTIKYYHCIKDSQINADLTDTTYFEEGDNRDKKLVEVILSMSLFYIHQRISPTNIPEFRLAAYDGNGNETVMSAIKWLTMIRNGKLTPFNWPKNTSSTVTGDDTTAGDDFEDRIMYGNSDNTSYFWYNTDSGKIYKNNN